MLAGRLQRYATALTARMENPVRDRHDLPPAPESGAALCRRLRASSRRSHRPAGQIQRQGRTQSWIKLRGKVTQLTRLEANSQSPTPFPEPVTRMNTINGKSFTAVLTILTIGHSAGRRSHSAHDEARPQPLYLPTHDESSAIN